MFARGFHRFVAFRYLRAYPKKWSPVLTNISIGLLLDIIVSAILHFKVAHAPVANPFNPTIPSGFFVGTSIAMLVGCVLLPVFGMLAIVRRYFSFYTTVSITGVWVGTMALVFVLSVMGGFESDLRQKILGSNAHIQITKEDGDFDDWRAVRSRIDHTEGVVASTPFALSEVVISANNNPLNVIIKGIDPKSVASVTELVKDLDDRDSINHLEPAILGRRQTCPSPLSLQAKLTASIRRRRICPTSQIRLTFPAMPSRPASRSIQHMTSTSTRSTRKPRCHRPMLAPRQQFAA